MTTQGPEPTDPASTAPDHEVVVLYPQTGALRIYANQGLAKMHVAPSELARYGLRSALDLKRAYAHDRLEDLWRRVRDHMVWGLPRTATGPALTDGELQPPDCGTDLLADELWAVMMRVGDRITVAAKAQASDREQYYLDRARIAAVLDDPDRSKAYPRQCRTIVQGLYDLKVDHVHEDRLRRMMQELVLYGQIKTKQEPWLLMQFYRKQLVDDGLMTRGGSSSTEDAVEDVAA